jgi:hypothetical protein
MKRAVSVSLGSTQRDKRGELRVLGELVEVERRGCDGDAALARRRFAELDGRVDALGVGGIDLWVGLDDRRYPIRAAQKLVHDVRVTPVVDGSGLKHTLEKQAAAVLAAELGRDLRGMRVMTTSGIDRFGLTISFVEAGCDVMFADLMFALGIPLPLRTLRGFRRMARWVAPVATQLPIDILYPTGAKQHEIVPRFLKWYAWAEIIAGDCLFIKRHMPEDLTGKIIVTNTTTAEDMRLFRERGVGLVMTTTPVIDGRTYGTNMMEAALTAVAGKGRPLTTDELSALIAQIGMKPMLHRL